MSHPWLTSDCLSLPMALKCSLIGSFHICLGKQSYRIWLMFRLQRLIWDKNALSYQVRGGCVCAPHSYHSVRGRLTWHKNARKINNAYSRVEPRHWQGHRSMLFPAFAKIPNSPYLIKRPLCWGWFTTPAIFMSICFMFFSLRWHLKWWEFYAFDNNMSFTLDQNSWPCQRAINKEVARETTERIPAGI